MADWNTDEYHDVCFAVRKSRRYHAKMNAFYDWCHHLSRAATALTGTASFFVLLAKGMGIATYLTAVVAAAASIDSVFRFERKARTHSALCRRFIELDAKIQRLEPVPANLRKVRAERLKIEADEPPVRRLIDLQAQNEECRAQGIGPEHLVPLGFLQRRLGYVFTFGMPRLERWEAQHRPSPCPPQADDTAAAA